MALPDGSQGPWLNPGAELPVATALLPGRFPSFLLR